MIEAMPQGENTVFPNLEIRCSLQGGVFRRIPEGFNQLAHWQ
jgi:hypothetical protein